MMGVMYVQISNKLFAEVLITWKGARFLFSTAHLTFCKNLTNFHFKKLGYKLKKKVVVLKFLS